MYAIIEACGKQYKVEKGSIVYFEKLDAEKGKKVTFDKVLLVSDKETKIGTPYVDGIKVEGKIVEHVKGEKIKIFKYKPKKNNHRKLGHRQPFTKLVVEKINA